MTVLMQPRDALLISLRSGTLALFDPKSLEHRRTADRKWMRDPAALAGELREANLAAVALGEKTTVRVEFGAPRAGVPMVGPMPLKVTGDSVYVGDVEDAPSKRWGRRRLSIWDLLLWIFFAAMIPFGLWYANLDRELLVFSLIGVVFTIAFMIPISYVFFKKDTGREFARNTGTPLGDHPDSVLPLAPGHYAVKLSRPHPDRALIVVNLERVEEMHAPVELPRLAAS